MSIPSPRLANPHRVRITKLPSNPLQQKWMLSLSPAPLRAALGILTLLFQHPSAHAPLRPFLFQTTPPERISPPKASHNRRERDMSKNDDHQGSGVSTCLLCRANSRGFRDFEGSLSPPKGKEISKEQDQHTCDRCHKRSRKEDEKKILPSMTDKSQQTRIGYDKSQVRLSSSPLLTKHSVR
ncbi:hypothetical protein CEXT_250661 [Caerostris extrusa]|uniref:Stc1 domain-containing protein n=1 Tax=Caerostris extrusa TaxID=172846 RepID=A0AAV4T5H2_CAEEX|nr:hypothetical protein CEXT_250661 [Caerostris extrusa]